MSEIWIIEALIKLTRKGAIIEFWSSNGSTFFNLIYECRHIELIEIADGNQNHYGYKIYTGHESCEERDYKNGEWPHCTSSFKGSKCSNMKLIFLLSWVAMSELITIYTVIMVEILVFAINRADIGLSQANLKTYLLKSHLRSFEIICGYSRLTKIHSHLSKNEHLWKDNVIKDFYGDWSIEETCDTITLESNLHNGFKDYTGVISQLFHTYECKDDKIAYFKVERNLIDKLPNSYLGKVRKIRFVKVHIYYSTARYFIFIIDLT